MPMLKNNYTAFILNYIKYIMKYITVYHYISWSYKKVLYPCHLPTTLITLDSNDDACEAVGLKLHTHRVLTRIQR